jgi:hypothetical protein
MRQENLMHGRPFTRLPGLCVAVALSATLLSSAVGQPVTGTSGDALRAAGEFAAAGRAYEAVLKASPADADALAGLAQIRLYENQVDDAMALAKRALAAEPSNPTALAALTTAQQRKDAFTGSYQISGLPSELAIPFVVTDPLPVVQVSVGGRQAHFMIDTGAPDIMLGADLAHELGVQVRSAGEGVFLGGARAPVQVGILPELQIGAVKIANVPAHILLAAPRFPNQGFKIEGVIGTGLLMHFLSSLDYCQGRLVLRPRDASSKVEQMAAAKGANVVPFWLAGDHFLVSRAHLQHGSEGLFVVDTGGAGIGLGATKATLDEAGIPIDPTAAQTRKGGGGEVTVIPFRSGAMLGSMTVEDVPGAYTPNGDPYGNYRFKVSGALSHGFFRHSSVTFDFDVMRLITEACGKP